MSLKVILKTLYFDRIKLCFEFILCRMPISYASIEDLAKIINCLSLVENLFYTKAYMLTKMPKHVLIYRMVTVEYKITHVKRHDLYLPR